MTQTNIHLPKLSGGPAMAPGPLFREFLQRDKWLTLSGVFLLALLVPSMIASWLDPRMFEATGVWVKPMKFQFSVGIYLLTLTWFMPYTRPVFLNSWRRKTLVILLILGGLFEVGYITVQGARGEASHFNNTSALYEILYGLMGLGALFLTGMAGWLGVEVARNRESHLSSVLRWSIALGLILSFVLGAIAGFTISDHNGPLIGVDRANSTGVWLFGWSREGGDLRVAHFIGTHAMHILPLAGLLLARLKTWTGMVWLGVVTAGFVLAWRFTYQQALAGLPFLG